MLLHWSDYTALRCFIEDDHQSGLTAAITSCDVYVTTTKHYQKDQKWFFQSALFHLPYATTDRHVWRLNHSTTNKRLLQGRYWASSTLEHCQDQESPQHFLSSRSFFFPWVTEDTTDPLLCMAWAEAGTHSAPWQLMPQLLSQEDVFADKKIRFHGRRHCLCVVLPQEPS